MQQVAQRVTIFYASPTARPLIQRWTGIHIETAANNDDLVEEAYKEIESEVRRRWTQYHKQVVDQSTGILARSIEDPPLRHLMTSVSLPNPYYFCSFALSSQVLWPSEVKDFLYLQSHY